MGEKEILKWRDKGKPININVVKGLHQVNGPKVTKGGWFGGLALFGSIPSSVVLKNQLKVFYTFIIQWKHAF